MNGHRGLDGAILVMAKAPVPGRVKTRLCPPCTLEEAARIAGAALYDTIRAVSAVPVPRRLVVLDGTPEPWLPEGFAVLPQRGNGLDERLAAAFEDAGGPALLIGTDTPQVTPDLLAHALAELLEGPGDAVLGLAADGGWWAIGLLRPHRWIFLGVPMSREFTGEAQAERLERLGLEWTGLPLLRDVDRFDDALAVAPDIPRSAFARAVGTVTDRIGLPAHPPRPVLAQTPAGRS